MAEDYCKICKEKFEEQSIYYFPKLPSTSKYTTYAGLVHVACLVNHKESNNIKDVLISAIKSTVAQDAGNPIVASEGRIIIQNRKYDECLNVYDFEDFADFYIPYWQIDALLELKPNEKIDLGVNKLVTLTLNDDGSLLLNTIRPYNRLLLKFLRFKMFRDLIGTAKEKISTQKSNADDMMEKWKAWTNG